jgi:hypothetical protein
MQIIHNHETAAPTSGAEPTWSRSPSHPARTVSRSAPRQSHCSTPTSRPAQIMKASRRLNRLVGDGLLVPKDNSRPTGGKPEKVYFAAARNDLGSNHGAITRPPVDNGNHGPDEQSRGAASSQVRAITAAITAFTPQEQSRTGPPLKGPVRLEVVPTTCVSCRGPIDPADLGGDTCDDCALEGVRPA